MSLDDPSITPSDKYRYDLGIAFPKTSDGILAEMVRSRGRGSASFKSLPTRSECAAAGFTVRDFKPRQIVAFHSVGDLDQVGRAWQYLYRIWLPSGGYQPADLPGMEMLVQIPEELGWETFDLEACIPVERL